VQQSGKNLPLEGDRACGPGAQHGGAPAGVRKADTVDKQVDLLQGTLDMLILKAVSLGPLHGYGVLLRIEQISKERLEIQQGSLYPALYRLEHQGWITSEWGESENKRKAKYYRLTAAGKRRLQTESEKWNRMADVIAGILGTTPEEV
jgi:PadR family transcriptional regulator